MSFWGSVQRAERAVTTVTPISRVRWTQKTSDGCSTTAEISSRGCTCDSTNSCDLLAGTLVLFTNVSANSPAPSTPKQGQNRRRRILLTFIRPPFCPRVAFLFLNGYLVRSGVGRDFLARESFIWIAFIFAIPRSLWLPPYVLLNVKNYKVVCIYVPPVGLWRSHHLVTSGSPSFTPWTLTFWPSGLSAAFRVQTLKSARGQKQGRVGGRGLSNTGKRRKRPRTLLSQDGHNVASHHDFLCPARGCRRGRRVRPH